MKGIQVNRSLAYEIGLRRIALVVDQQHRKLKQHPALGEIVTTGRSHEEERARLTYFWWVILGGNSCAVSTGECAKWN